MTTPSLPATTSPVAGRHDEAGAKPGLRRLVVPTSSPAAPTDHRSRPSAPLDLGQRSRGRAIKDVVA
ncbi:MAG: hypothetical protein ABJA89_06345, partial [Lapillicoccus sp.]